LLGQPEYHQRLERSLLPSAEAFFGSRTKGFRRYGRRARARCPFHPRAEHQNFSIDLERGLYKCFVCGACGDMLTFVMEQDGVGFIEAARQLGALVPGDDAEERRFREERVAKDRVEQAKQDAWALHLEAMAREMETLERVRDWAFQHRRDAIVELAQMCIELTVAEYLLAKREVAGGR